MTLISGLAWFCFAVLLSVMLKFHRQSMQAMKARYASWHRQRWSISHFNGRHNLGFGYYLHRSVS